MVFVYPYAVSCFDKKDRLYHQQVVYAHDFSNALAIVQHVLPRKLAKRYDHGECFPIGLVKPDPIPKQVFSEDNDNGHD